ncbi:SirB1 family protein [Piscinibacter sakaiensis]|uniref:SirB1 family protein n=1 Tax=Piscinibacter sakaiensis TaxID=1547922 RepID=UPI003AAE3171
MPTYKLFDPPTALSYFSALVADDASIPLTEAALAIAQQDDARLDVQAVLSDIDALAGRLARRIPADAPSLHRLRLLNRYFFQELGFAGNLNNYYDPANSYLPQVLATRRGIPISLAVLYIEFAGQIGLHARGVSFPGHFLVKLRVQGGIQSGEVVIDPMNGHSLSREQLDEMLLPYKRSHGLIGDFDMPLGLFLQEAPAREVLARMLRNLKEIHRSEEDWPRLLSVLHRLVILLPDGYEELRDRGLTWAELGQFESAVQDLSAYLDARPDAVDRDAIDQRLNDLRASGGRPRLH